MTLLILLCAGVSLLMIGLSVPLIGGWVKPNPWYGLRIPLTLDNPDIWYPANRYAGWLLLIYGLVMLAVSLGLPILLDGLAEEAAVNTYGLSVAAIMLLGLVPVVILSLRYARKLASSGSSGQ
jgi:hypothetical protein